MFLIEMQKKAVLKPFQCDQTEATNKVSGKQIPRPFLFSGQVSGQQIQKIVLAARPARLRKEGLGIHVIPI